MPSSAIMHAAQEAARQKRLAILTIKPTSIATSKKLSSPKVVQTPEVLPLEKAQVKTPKHQASKNTPVKAAAVKQNIKPPDHALESPALKPAVTKPILRAQKVMAVHKKAISKPVETTRAFTAVRDLRRAAPAVKAVIKVPEQIVALPITDASPIDIEPEINFNAEPKAMPDIAQEHVEVPAVIDNKQLLEKEIAVGTYTEEPNYEEIYEPAEPDMYIEQQFTEAENIISVAQEIEDETGPQNLEVQLIAEYQDFAVVLGYEKPIVMPEDATEITPLPPVCAEVSAAMQELAPEPAAVAQEKIHNIIKKIDDVFEQRMNGSELAPASEQELAQLCIDLFEYLGVAYSPETVMEFVEGIVEIKKLKIKELNLANKTIPPQKHDRGTREDQVDDDQTPSHFAQILDFPRFRNLGNVILQLAA